MKDFFLSDCARFENKVIISSFVVTTKQVKPKTRRLTARAWETPNPRHPAGDSRRPCPVHGHAGGSANQRGILPHFSGICRRPLLGGEHGGIGQKGNLSGS
jgi:hypothetical protein